MRITLTTAAALLFLFVAGTVSAFAAGGTGRNAGTLKKEWKQYEKLAVKDRPDDELKLLASIMDKAKEAGLPLDYYDAAQRVQQTRSRRNWKDYEQARRDMDAAVLSFGCPALSAWHIYQEKGAQALLDHVGKEADALRKSSSPEVWKRFPAGFSDYHRSPYRNDLDYALMLALSGQDGSAAMAMLEAETPGEYPIMALARYIQAGDGLYRSMEVKEKLAKEWPGSVIALIVEKDRLAERYERMVSDERRFSSEEFTGLRDGLVSLQKRFRAASSSEPWYTMSAVPHLDVLVRQLEASSAMAKVDDDVLKLDLRNVKSFSVELLSGKKTVWKTSAVNPVGSFYKQDTVSVALPDLEDGLYKVKISAKGGVEQSLVYDKSSLSIAGRWYDGRYWIYVADYRTGRPVEKADLSFSGTYKARYKGFELDGFTAIPTSASLSVHDDVLHLLCSYRDAQGRLLKTPELTVSPFRIRPYDGASELDSQRSSVFLSSGAYHPGDTVRFKAVFSHGDYVWRAETVPAGEKCLIECTSPDGSWSKSLELVTNEFGSVAGEFVLPSDCANGRWSIRTNGNYMGTTFYVGEYVLPTYSISVEPQDRFIFAGDSVKVRGTVKSYSGHALSSARLQYRLSSDEPQEGEAEIASDGSFEIAVVAPRWSNSVKIKVTDATGETAESDAWIQVSAEPYFLVHVIGEDDASSVGHSVISDSRMRFKTWINESYKPLPVRYSVLHEGRELVSGETMSGQEVSVDLPGSSFLCEIRTEMTVVDDHGSQHTYKNSRNVLYISDEATMVDYPAGPFLKKTKGDGISCVLGTGSGEIWAVAELWDCNGRLLDAKNVHLDGIPGKDGSAMRLDWVYEKWYGDAVNVRVFYFRDGRSHVLNLGFRRPFSGSDMPLEFERFVDNTLPGNPYLFSVKTLADAECVASVYDKGTDAIFRNQWRVQTISGPGLYYVRQEEECGSHDSSYPVLYAGGQLKGVRKLMAKAGLQSGAVLNDAVEMVVEEEAIPFRLAPRAASPMAQEAALLEEVGVRSEFADVLAFEPFLRTDGDGVASFTVNTSDKLSTYHVAVYAHDRQMHNAYIVRDMVVSVPVKVSVAQPQFLYEKDRYVLNATVSNIGDEACDGVFSIDLYDGGTWKGAQPVAHIMDRAVVPASGSVKISLPVESVPHCTSGTLGMKIAFACRNSEGQNVSDGMFVTVPVLEPVQKIVESHSAVLRPGMDRAALADSLMTLFRNGRKADTQERCISIKEQLMEVLAECSHTEAVDAVSLSSAIEFNLLASSLSGGESDCSGMVKDLLALRCSDGGFAWMPGMGSSATVTAVVLERLARLRRLGLIPSAFGDDVTSAAVTYLDSCWASPVQPKIWRPWISQSQYFYVRSFWPEVPFTQQMDKDRREADRRYLTPSQSLKYDSILSKARRIRTIMNLQASESGVGLAKAWGVKLMTSKKLEKTLENDLESLMQYAVGHVSGGVYYPNAVLPWRGLQESELYAHSLICDLMRDVEACGLDSGSRAHDIAEGIRLWIMIQKETQHWEKDSAFAEAAASVYDGSQNVMDTRVLALTRTSSIPFASVRKAGNGMSVSVEWSVLRGGRWVALREGERLQTGASVRATWRLYSAENRSFVRLSASRPACLSPVEQRSGYHFMGCYRDVRRTATEYLWDAFPEEKTTVTEEFHVTQEGVFTSPAPVIESLYALHYRANGAPSLPIRSEFVN